MEIKQYLSTLDIAYELPLTKHLLTDTNGNVPNATAEVSFWGERLVKVLNHEGLISLNELCTRIMRAAQQRSDADDLSTEERIDGIDIKKKLFYFEKITDDKISNANWFTWLLCKIRECTFFLKIPPEPTADIDRYFRGYSENQFIKEFGGPLDKEGNHPDSDGFGYKIMAKEKSIRAKLVPNQLPKVVN